MYAELLKAQRDYFASGATRSVEARKQTLGKLLSLATENLDDIKKAYAADLGRGELWAAFESKMAHDMVEGVVEKLDEWTKTIELETAEPLDAAAGDRLVLVKEPLGVCLNICPWNAPIISLFTSVYALAAGNTMVYKPSELSPAFAALMDKLFPKYFDRGLFACVIGGIPETTALLAERYDHIFYTGNTMVAKIIYAAAAKNLTPVVLELGGKNPVFIDDTADVEHAVSKLIQAKTFGSGQACVCSDYIMATPKARVAVIEQFQKQLAAVGSLKGHQFAGKIVNARHWDRIMGMFNSSKGKVVARAEGEPNKDDLFIPITLVECSSLDDPLCDEEIFGTIYPIVEVSGIDAALAQIHRKEKPLAAYVFTADNAVAEKFVKNTSSGGVTVNDIMVHCMTRNAPFGGVGHSGMGRLISKWGFDSFTHEKPVAVLKGLQLNI